VRAVHRSDVIPYNGTSIAMPANGAEYTHLNRILNWRASEHYAVVAGPCLELLKQL
jgi:hypothetical protein